MVLYLLPITEYIARWTAQAWTTEWDDVLSLPGSDIVRIAVTVIVPHIWLL